MDKQAAGATRPLITGFSAITLAVLAATSGAHAASATWLPNPASGDWVTTTDTNWSTPGAFPGALGTTTNGDTATFITSNQTAVNVNQAGLNVRFIAFVPGGGAVSSYTFGGNPINLTHAGSISIGANASGTAAQTFNTPLVLLPASATTAGSYTFENAAVAANPQNFLFAGGISGGTTTAAVTLNLGRSATASTISGDISNGNAASVGIVKSANLAGTWVLSGNNTYTGRTQILGGSLSVSSINSVNAAGTAATAASSSLGAPTSPPAAASDMVANNSSGTLIYTGAGETTNRVINLDSVSTSNLDASGTGAVVFTGDLATSTRVGVRSLGLTGTSTAANTFAGNINNGLDSAGGAAVVSVVKNGAGRWVLSGNNGYTGTTTVSAGTLGVGSNNALGSAGSVTVGLATIEAAGGNRTLAGNFNLSGNATVGGTNTLTFNGALLAATNQTLTVSDGATLVINGNGSAPSNTTTGRTLTITGGGNTVLNGTYVNSTAAGAGNSGLSKGGTGTLTLAAANPYGGTTTIGGGTLLANNTAGSATGTGPVLLSTDGGGRLGGSGRVAPTGTAGITFNASTLLSPGSAAGNNIGTLTIDLTGTTGNVAVNRFAVLEYNLGTGGASLAAPGTSDLLQLVVGATTSRLNFFASGNGNEVSLLGATDGVFKLIDADLANATVAGDAYGNLTYNETTGVVTTGLFANLPAGNAQFLVGTASNGGDLGDVYVQIVGVPEPTTLAALSLGATALLRRRRRQG